MSSGCWPCRILLLGDQQHFSALLPPLCGRTDRIRPLHHALFLRVPLAKARRCEVRRQYDRLFPHGADFPAVRGRGARHGATHVDQIGSPFQHWSGSAGDTQRLPRHQLPIHTDGYGRGPDRPAEHPVVDLCRLRTAPAHGRGTRHDPQSAQPGDPVPHGCGLCIYHRRAESDRSQHQTLPAGHGIRRDLPHAARGVPQVHALCPGCRRRFRPVQHLRGRLPQQGVRHGDPQSALLEFDDGPASRG